MTVDYVEVGRARSSAGMLVVTVSVAPARHIRVTVAGRAPTEERIRRVITGVLEQVDLSGPPPIPQE